MPAQNSRSIWIRGGAIGAVAFFFASVPGAALERPALERSVRERSARKQGLEQTSSFAFAAVDRALVLLVEWAQGMAVRPGALRGALREAPRPGIPKRTPWLRKSRLALFALGFSYSS